MQFFIATREIIINLCSFFHCALEKDPLSGDRILSIRRRKKKVYNRILRENDAKVLLNALYPGDLDITLLNDSEIRFHFGFTKNHPCVDVVAHYKKCPWILIEETTKEISHGLYQLRMMAEYLQKEGNGVEIKFAIIFCKKIDKPIKFGKQGIHLIKKNTRKPWPLIKCNHGVFLVYYDTNLQEVYEQIMELDVKKNSKFKERKDNSRKVV